MSKHHPTFERLLSVMRKRGLAAPDVYCALGITRQAFNNWQRRKVPDEYFLKLSKLLRCNLEWLATGRGEMLEYGPPPPIHDASVSALSEDALFIARVFMIASPDMKRAWRLVAEDYISRLSPREQKAFRDALEDDMHRYTGVVRLPPADSA